MFWGSIIKPGKPYSLQKELTDVLRLSNVSLHPNAQGKSSLFIKVGDNESILIASLEAGKHEHSTLDLYVRISDGVTFTVQGKGDIHLSGYLDPSDDDLSDMEDDMDDDEFKALQKEQKKLQKELENSEDELDEEDLAPAKPTKQVKTDAKPAQPVKPAAPVQKAAPAPAPVKAAPAPAPAKPAPAKAAPAPQPAKQAKAAPAKPVDEDEEDGELNSEDIENMTESELAALEAELGEDGEEELDEDELDGLEDDDLEGMDEEGEEEDGEGEEEEEEKPAKKHIPNVSDH
jgi:hypothetical protein